MKIKHHLTILGLIFSIIQVVIGVVFLDIQRHHNIKNTSESKKDSIQYQTKTIVDRIKIFESQNNYQKIPPLIDNLSLKTDSYINYCSNEFEYASDFRSHKNGLEIKDIVSFKISGKNSGTIKFTSTIENTIIESLPYLLCFFSVQVAFNVVILVIFSSWASANIIIPISHAIHRLSDNEQIKGLSMSKYMPIEVYKLNLLLEQKSNQLASIKELNSMARTAQVIAHDIRRPIGMVRLIINQLKDKSKTSNFLNNIEKYQLGISDAMESVDNMLHDLMALEGRPNRLREKFPLNYLIHNSIKENLQLFYNGDVTISYKIDNRCWCFVDKSQILRSFSNIIHNAFSAMNNKGEIWIKTNHSEQGLNLTIGNSGSFIPPEKRKRIFEAYYGSSAKGRGLGLSVAKLQIVAHGGDIKVYSCKEKGTEFKIFLPAKILSYQDSEFIEFYSSTSDFRNHLNLS